MLRVTRYPSPITRPRSSAADSVASSGSVSDRIGFTAVGITNPTIPRSRPLNESTMSK